MDDERLIQPGSCHKTASQKAEVGSSPFDELTSGNDSASRADLASSPLSILLDAAGHGAACIQRVKAGNGLGCSCQTVPRPLDDAAIAVGVAIRFAQIGAARQVPIPRSVLLRHLCDMSMRGTRRPSWFGNGLPAGGRCWRVRMSGRNCGSSARTRNDDEPDPSAACPSLALATEASCRALRDRPRGDAGSSRSCKVKFWNDRLHRIGERVRGWAVDRVQLLLRSLGMQYGGLHRDPEVDEYGEETDVLDDDAGWSDRDGDGDGDGDAGQDVAAIAVAHDEAVSLLVEDHSETVPTTVLGYRQPTLPVRLGV